jgi:hypothetical protein
MSDARFVQRCTKRSQTQVVASKKTLDYSSRDVLNARERSTFNLGLINLGLNFWLKFER